MRRILTLAVMVWIACGAAASARPHIILVMADDQGWGDMAYNGHPTVVTPHFDEAAAKGIRFDRFYAAAPVCSPTRASVLTGRTPNRLGVFKWGYPIREQEETLAEILREAGYATGHFGKWHLGSVRRQSRSNPGYHGFDRWISAPNFYENGATLSDEGTARTFDGVESSFIAVDSALEWIEEAGQDQPIFAVIWLGSPHSPHIADPIDSEHYADLPKADREFLGEVTGMDRAFGKLRQSLETLGMRENTLLWYCSDNGALPKVGRTGGFRADKGDVYDGGLLVPSILEWPARFPKPAVIEARSNTFDILPTVLELAQIDRRSAHQLDGESLLPLLEETATQRTRPMGFWDNLARGISTPSENWMQELKEAQAQGGDLPPNSDVVAAMALPDPRVSKDSFPGHSAWIDGDWKLHRIESKAGQVKVELYDLKSDPFEETDLAGENPDRVEAMQTALQEWLSDVVDSLNGEEYES